MLETLLYVLQVIVGVFLIGIILIQQGKGADAGAAFGSGASSTVFGSHGSFGFMTKLTSVLAVVFMLNSLALGYFATQRSQTVELNVIDRVEMDAQQQSSSELPDIVTEEASDTKPVEDLPALPSEQ